MTDLGDRAQPGLPSESRTQWDEYWEKSAHDRGLFATLAKRYRRQVISRAVRHYFRRYFRDTAEAWYLHAGCGSGESDNRILFRNAHFVLMDLSVSALRIARERTTLSNVHLVCADINDPPFRPGTFDGIWNLGVMEHFEETQITRIFAALGALLKEGARGLFFWPPIFGASVLGLGVITLIADRVFCREIRFWPDEVSLFRSVGWVRGLVTSSALSVEHAHFSPRDLLTYVVVVLRRQ